MEQRSDRTRSSVCRKREVPTPRVFIPHTINREPSYVPSATAKGTNILRLKDRFEKFVIRLGEIMKKLTAVLLFCAVTSWAGIFGGGTGQDYSYNAASTYVCSDLQGTAVTTAAGLSPLNPALTLFNPYGSGKNLVLLETAADITSSPAAAVGFSIAYSTAGALPASTTYAQISKSYVNVSSTGTIPSIGNVGLCYRAATLASVPVALRYIGGVTGASAISGYTLLDQTNGKVVVPPGGTISIQSTAAAAIVAHFTWREDPI
jgi:hypothetical protein